MELGIFTRAYQELNMEEAFERISSLGIRQIEVVANRGSKHIDLSSALQTEYQNAYTKLLNRTGLNISALALHRDSQLVLGPHGEATQHFFPGSADEQVAYASKRVMLAADVAEAYGIPLVVGYLGCPNFSDYYPWPNKDGWKKQLNLAYERWMPILEHYEKRNVKFAHEIGPQQLAYNLETTEEILEHLPINSLGICIDPSNYILMGVNPSVLIERLATKIVHCHGKDAELTHHLDSSGWLSHGDLARENRGIRFRIPGWGDVNWRKTLTSLHLSGYRGVISIEIEDFTMGIDEAVQKSITFLSPLLFANES